MNTDNYDFDKSSIPQDLDGYTPFIDKQTNSYINDQNSGVYSATQSLISWDLSSLYNSSRWTNTNDMFVTIPIIMAMAIAPLNGAPAVAPPTAAWALATLKSGYHHLISQADLQIDGKTVSETQPFLGTFTHVKLLSELSQNDLKSFGSVIGFSDVLDTPNSVIWNSSVTDGDLTNGNGLTNNNVFGTTTQTTASANQNTGICNEAINKRALKVLDITKAGINKIVGAGNIYENLGDLNKLKAEYKSTYYVSGNYGYITDLAIIRLKDIFDCMNNIGIVKRFNGVLRIYCNTGALHVTCNVNNTSDVGTANPNYKFSVSNSTFTNVCPFTINNLNSLGSVAGIPFAQKQLAVGLFIGKTLPTNNNGINLGATTVSHPQTSCRLYYSSIIMEPERALTYSRANQAKNVVFKNYYFNQISGVGVGSNYSQLIQSGITNPYALIVIPYIGTTNTGMAGMSQYQSPFDTAPASGAPIVLEELQVQIGGQQVLSSPYRYGFETFVSQFSNCEALTSSDFGVSCGIVNYEWWQANRIYYINLSRSTKADQITPRNVVLSFKNASSVSIDVQVFTVYLDRITLNVDTGAVTR